MSRANRIELQQTYKKFDRNSKIIIALMVVAGFALLTGFIICTVHDKSNPILVLISMGLLALWFVTLFSIINRLNNKRIRLHEAVYGKDGESTRSGLFGEIREAIAGCQLKVLPDNSKVNFAETYNDVIELEILRHAHEFHITIDKDAVYMVMDDETDSPVEKEISLSEMTEVGQVFAAIRDFIGSV